MAKVYVGTLERFGYNLLVVETTKEKAIAALRAEYIKAYKECNNGIHPSREHSYREDQSDLDIALEDIYAREAEFGKVEWC